MLTSVVGGTNPAINQQFRKLVFENDVREYVYKTALDISEREHTPVASTLRALAYITKTTTDRQNVILAELAKQNGLIMDYNA